MLNFGLDCRLLVFFTHTPQSQEKLLTFPAFLEQGSAEKIAVCAHTTHDPNKGGWLEAFLYEAAQNFFSKIQDQN